MPPHRSTTQPAHAQRPARGERTAGSALLASASSRLRRASAPIALLTWTSFVGAMLTTQTAARAEESHADWKLSPSAERAVETVDRAASVPSSESPATASTAVPVTAAATVSRAQDLAAQMEAAALAPSGAPPLTPEKLTIGGDKSGVSSQAITTPQGAGKVQGWGESFSAQLSTGIGTFSVPLSLPDARGGIDPSLALAYSSSGAHGVAGIGWEIGVPFIARQTDRGAPSYVDPGAAWNPAQDRFVFNGGQELVPICVISTSGTCPLASAGTLGGVLAGEAMPAWAGWMYFRARVEGSFLRFFWSPDHRTWRAQDKTGGVLELGAPTVGTVAGGDDSAIESDPSDPTHARIFRWNLSRQYDQHVVASGGATVPANLLVYQYLRDGSAAYLQDIYDTPPASGDVTTLARYAHHTRLDYEPRTDPTASYRRSWRVDYRLRLKTVTVTSMPFTPGATSARELVRRYRLSFDPGYHASLLSQVVLEGRCPSAMPEGPSGDIGASSCPTLPPMTFGYSHVTAQRSDGTAVPADLPGYEPFDERLHAMVGSPDHSVDEESTDLFDINADGLPDVVVTAPMYYAGKHGVFYNGRDGVTGTFAAVDTMSVIPAPGIPGDTATVINLANANVQAGDLDSDGIVNLIHMPAVKTYSVFTPTETSPKHFDWVGRPIALAASLSPKIDFGKDGDRQRLADVNGDGLVDVVRSTGTQMQTFLALGRYPGGDGLFGHAVLTSATTANLSTDPIVSCIPFAGTAAAFDDATIKLADMNGDGLVDIVRINPGSIVYWPGNGNGYWGTGSIAACAAGGPQGGVEIAMANAPHWADPTSAGVRLDDVNGDGLDDVVQTGFSTVSIWLNVDGIGFTPSRHMISGTPAEPSYAGRIRLADMNGSGTRDILWGDAFHYQYIDLTGGTQPWLLTDVANGLGKTTHVDYASSTELLQASRAAGTEWKSRTPSPFHVVVRETEDDHLDLVGRPRGTYVTEYHYRDPVYDGVQREFRGFSTADARRIGDANSPSATTATTFLLGQCGSDEVTDGLGDPCSFAGRWRDNPREALKGLPVRSDTFDDAKNYLHTVHHQYRLRTLYTGLDGRRGVHAFEEQGDDFTYDTGPFVKGSSATPPLIDVTVEPTSGSTVVLAIAPTPTAGNPLSIGPQPFLLPSDAAHTARTTHAANADAFGNATYSIDFGCVACGDTPIRSFTDPGRVPGDRTGWQWRTVHAFTLGDDASMRHETYNQYNTAIGDLIGTQAVLSGTIPLARTAPTSTNGAIAQPTTVSTDRTIQTSTLTVDAYGQTVVSVSAGGHRHEIQYDGDYQQLAVTEKVFAGAPRADGTALAPFGLTQLGASATYDRGLQLITTTTDLHGEPTQVAYDGFGRVVSMNRPSGELARSLSAQPSVTIEYFLASDPATVSAGPQPATHPYSMVHTKTHDGTSEADTSFREAWAYADGMGRAILTLEQADTTAGDLGPWVAKGLTEYDAKGAAKRAYRAWFYSGSPAAFDLSSAAPAKYGEQRYDAFGRQVESFNLDGTLTMRHVYHALSSDLWDAADLYPGPHQGTYASAYKDGHGRDIAAVERVRRTDGALEEHWTHSVYLTTGEVAAIVRNQSANTRDAASPRVVRFSRYDSLGRLLMNVDPSASSGVPWTTTGDPLAVTCVAPGCKAWRYAYDDAGDLVGTSDARGCGVNFAYDTGGRLTSETYSSCTAEQTPNLSGRPDVEYSYDTQVDFLVPGWTCDTTLLLGRLTAVRDRASRIRTCYDGRGRVTAVQKQLARADVPFASGSADYSAEAPVLSTQYDAADRPIVETSPSVDPAATSTTPGRATTVGIKYSKRGAVVQLTSSYGDLVKSVIHDADGQLRKVVYADAARTQTDLHYDDRLRLEHVLTSRGPPLGLWSATTGYTPLPTPTGAPTSFQLVLQDATLGYDEVDNPTEIRDDRIAAEWPAGAKPANRRIAYDDLYRVTRVNYERPGAEVYQDPYRTGPSSTPGAPVRPRQTIATRTTAEGIAYDWLGNTVATDDDQHAFVDRSLGAIKNGEAGASPYQLTSAAQAVTGGTLNGALWTIYDVAGNLTDLAIARDCGLGGGNCSVRYHYIWDEVGRLTKAARLDLAKSQVPVVATPWISGTTPTYQESYLYDSGDGRVITRAIAAAGAATSDLYYFASYEQRKTAFDAVGGRYTCATGGCARAYLMAHGARVAHLDVEPLGSGLPYVGGTDSRVHVMLEVADYLGSTNIVVDRDTSELVEWASYSAMGGEESEYRSGRWGGWREEYGFTGKEEARGLGITYFGARWLVPALGRWASADPLTVHGGGADLNGYAYVHGWIVRSTDPLGLTLRDAVEIWIMVHGETAGKIVDVGSTLGRYVPGLPGKILQSAGMAKSLIDASYDAPLPTIETIERASADAQVAILSATPALRPAPASTAAPKLASAPGKAAPAGTAPGAGPKPIATPAPPPTIAPPPRPATPPSPPALAPVAAPATPRAAVPPVASPTTPVARLPQDIAVSPKAPRALPLTRPVGSSPRQNAQVQADIKAAQQAGAKDFRVNQQQVNANGERVGINRPDLQYTDGAGVRQHIEYDTPSSGRGPAHAERLNANDPGSHTDPKIVP